jgi:SAM-dependent methyltransferase
LGDLVETAFASRTDTATRPARGVIAAFVVAVFVGAFVLFAVEPMVGKMLLPLAGGTAAIWTTTVLFFQVTLTAGYLYVHWLSERLRPRVQVVVHLVLMLAVLPLLPISLHLPGPAPTATTPVAWLLAVLALSIGLPFFVVSTTSPLLQRWLSLTRHAVGVDPYRLYQASNLGSVAALLAYPSLIENRFGILAQQRVWAAGYGVLVLLALYCASRLWASPPRLEQREVVESTPPVRIDWIARARWLALAAVPSVWLLGVTSYFTTSIRPLPLFWVVPLAIYLLSLALVFGRRPLNTYWLRRAFPFLAVPLLGFTVLGGQGPFWFLAGFHLGVFFVGAIVCHAQLAAERPPVKGLTGYYLWVSVGGALGGVFAALLAPLVFNDYLEYPLAIVAACFLRPSLEPLGTLRAAVRDLGAGAALLVGLLAAAGIAAVSGLLGALDQVPVSSEATAADVVRAFLVLVVPAVAGVAFSTRQLRFGLAAAAVLAMSLVPIGSRSTVIYQVRDFYGVHTVATDAAGTRHLLMDGVTIHGSQLDDPALRDVPTAYYTRSGPVGDVFRGASATDASGRIGVIGLGAGDMSCYATPGQHWTYFELDPTLVAIARDPRYFTYLRDCPGGGTDIVTGDGRLSLAADRGPRFDLLFVDAFGSDAPPTHLLTREAIRLYLDHLAPGGLLVFNISNRYLDLSSVLSAEASDLNLTALEKLDPSVSAAEAAAGKFPSDWLVMAPSAETLDRLAQAGGWVHPSPNPAQRVWTDDYSNVLAVTRF